MAVIFEREAVSARDARAPLWRARFAAGTRRAARYWLGYVRRHRDDPAALAAERENILRALRWAADGAEGLNGDWSTAASLALAYAPHMESSGSWRRWAGYLEALIAAPDALRDPVIRARLRRILATALARLGQSEAAVRQLKLAINPLREAGAWNPLARVLVAVAHWRVGARRGGAEVYVREAESLAAEMRNLPVLIDIAILRGRLALQDGRSAEAAAEYFARALELAREAGHRPLEKEALHFLGTAHLQAGAPDAALTYFWSALDLARWTGDRPGQGVILMNVGRAYLDLGQPALAAVHLQASLRLTRRTDNRPAECAALSVLGDAYRASGDADLAESCYRQAIDLAETLDDTRREARVRHALRSLRDGA